MLTLVTGGAASGKSGYAEGLLAPFSGPKIYLATMHGAGEEGAARIARHRALRAGKGFDTLECPLALESAAGRLPMGAAVLLEDLGNLAANELFDPDGAGASAFGAILRGIDACAARAAQLVIVSNELFSDGIFYDADTERYLALLAALHGALAARAKLIEVVCGIPIVRKEDSR
ncbi:MAG: bifunctional adenosylcobinamide kinase/adenosylcobinamide-phosphate guanylyltransferase [Oscillospiraceae bacterium]